MIFIASLRSLLPSAVWELAESRKRDREWQPGILCWSQSVVSSLPCSPVVPGPRLYIIAINYQQFTGLEVSCSSGGGDINQSQASIQVTWSKETNQRPATSWGGGVIDIVTEYSGF